jgi:hypothetical protein
LWFLYSHLAPAFTPCLSKFNEAHGIQYLQLDPITSMILMLSTGAYGLGTDWIASQYGGVLSEERFSSFMAIARNGLMSTLRVLLCQICHGTNFDTESMRRHSLGRNVLLPPLTICTRMSLDELKALEGNGMQVPERLRLMDDGEIADPEGPQAVIVDLAAELSDRLVDTQTGSLAIGAALKAKGAHINPLILPAFALGGDNDGSYTAANLAAVVACAEQRGLLACSEPEIYASFTHGTAKLAKIKCGQQEFETVGERIEFLFGEYQKSQPTELPIDLRMMGSVEELADEFEAAKEAATGELHLRIVATPYWQKDVGMVGAQAEQASDKVTAMAIAAGTAATPSRTAGGSARGGSPSDMVLPTLHGGHSPAALPALPMPEDEAEPAAKPAPKLAPALGPTELDRTGYKEQMHYSLVAFWAGHSRHQLVHQSECFEDLATEKLWEGVAQQTSIDGTVQYLLRHAPKEYFLHGQSILANKAVELQMRRPTSLVPRRELSEFTHPPLDLTYAVLLCGESNAGKTCFAKAHGKRPYIIKTLDMLKYVPADCDLLIFDDMRFDKGECQLSPEQIINLLTVDEMGSIQCRHFDGSIPCIPRIFTTNLDPSRQREHPFPIGENPEHGIAIRRRHRVYSYIRRGDLHAEDASIHLPDEAE